MTQISTHNIDAQKRLLQQYKGKEKIEALLAALGSDQIQDLEDTLTQLLSRLVVDNSEGVQLDNIGKIVGQPRNGQDDATYQIFIHAKIGRNVSEGDIERVISVWKILSQAGTVQVIENFPAEVELYSDSPLSDALAAIAFPLMQDVVGAGIKVVSSVITEGIPFGFDGGIGVLGFDTIISTGQNSSVSSFKLIDSGADFVADGVAIGNEVIEVAGDVTALVTNIDSPIQLTLDTDIFLSSPIDYDIIDGNGGKLAHVQAA